MELKLSTLIVVEPASALETSISTPSPAVTPLEASAIVTPSFKFEAFSFVLKSL